VSGTEPPLAEDQNGRDHNACSNLSDTAATLAGRSAATGVNCSRIMYRHVLIVGVINVDVVAHETGA
jgi:hypothetical protein